MAVIAAAMLSACLRANLPITRAWLSVADDGGGLRNSISNHH